MLVTEDFMDSISLVKSKKSVAWIRLALSACIKEGRERGRKRINEKINNACRVHACEEGEREKQRGKERVRQKERKICTHTPK